MIVPMLAGDRVVAVLNLADKRTGEPFDETTDLPPLEQLSIVVGSAIRNWQLFQEVKAAKGSDGIVMEGVSSLAGGSEQRPKC